MFVNLNNNTILFNQEYTLTKYKKPCWKINFIYILYTHNINDQYNIIKLKVIFFVIKFIT